VSLMNSKDFAAHRGVSPMAVSKWLKSGVLGAVGDAFQKSGRLYLIDSEKADVLLEVNKKVTMQQTLPLEGKDPAKKDLRHSYNSARTTDAQYSALLRKLEYEIKTGTYVFAEEVKRGAFNAARSVRDSLLNIPDRVAQILAAESDPVAINGLLAVELHKALENLVQELAE
jgi:hypothetical protein